jgi:hypothetical protein
MTTQPDHGTLNLARIEAKMLDWARAGRQVYKMEARGDQPVRPSDIIHLAEYPDLAHAWDKGGDDLDGPVALTDEPSGDAMRWTGGA